MRLHEPTDPSQPDLVALLTRLRADTPAGRIQWKRDPDGEGYRVRQGPLTVRLRATRFFDNPTDEVGEAGHQADLYEGDTFLEVLSGTPGDDPHGLQALYDMARASVSQRG